MKNENQVKVNYTNAYEQTTPMEQEKYPVEKQFNNLSDK